MNEQFNRFGEYLINSADESYDSQQLENLFNICRVGYESMNFDLLVSSCHFDYNKYLFKNKYSHINFQDEPKNKNHIDSLFGKWCSLFILLNCKDPNIIQWKLTLIEEFPLLIELKNVITHGWTTIHKPVTLERARQMQCGLVNYMVEFIYLTQNLEKYNEKRRIMERFKVNGQVPTLSEWENDMIEWLYRQGGEMYCKSEKIIHSL